MSLTKNEGQKRAGGVLYPAASVADEDLAGLCAWYKRVVASSYRAIRDDDLTTLPTGELVVSPKVDGQMWYLVKMAGEIALVAHNGRVLMGDVPLLVEARKTFGSRAEDGTVVAGELFSLGGGGNRPRVGDVAQAMVEGSDGKALGFMAFDLVKNAGEQASRDYKERFDEVKRLLDGGKRVKAIKTETVMGHDALMALYDEWVKSGKSEGMVARAEDGRTYKIKPAFDLDCLVIGFTENHEDKPHVRSLLLGLLREDGTTQVIGSVAAHMPFEEKVALLERLEPTVTSSRFRRASSSGAMYRMVNPTLAVEIRCSDLQAEDSTGKAIRQWALKQDDDGVWQQLAPVNGAGILHPKLTRLREDKNIDTVDLRIAQLTERCMIADLGKAVEAVQLPKSDVVRREVYTKTTKGKVAVRKLLVWKTNKEAEDKDFPAYVVHFTDYSPGRKEPIKRTVRLAPSADLAEALADDLVFSNIKRGWAKVEAEA